MSVLERMERLEHRFLYRDIRARARARMRAPASNVFLGKVPFHPFHPFHLPLVCGNLLACVTRSTVGGFQNGEVRV
jgi:hypothetical protein